LRKLLEHKGCTEVLTNIYSPLSPLFKLNQLMWVQYLYCNMYSITMV